MTTPDQLAQCKPHHISFHFIRGIVIIFHPSVHPSNHPFIHFFRFVLLKHSHIVQHPEAFDIESVRGPRGPFSYEHPFTCAKGMNDRFTQRVRKVLFLARDEAGRLQHDYIGTEHLLLGLIREGEEAVSPVKPARAVTSLSASGLLMLRDISDSRMAESEYIFLPSFVRSEHRGVLRRQSTCG